MLVLIFAATAAGPVAAQASSPEAHPEARPEGNQVPAPEVGPSGRPLPRFVTLRAAKVNLRSGPGIRYPIEWVYALKGLPIEVIDEFETWRRIRDWQGSVGWVHQNMLSGQRGAMVTGETRLLRSAPDDGAPGIAQVEAGTVGVLRRCVEGWCRIEIKGFDGWLPQGQIYGAYPSEAVE